MAILKCKMCGGDLHIEEGMTVCECEYCGSKQTVPTVDNEKKITLYERANRLRYNCEFDKAETVYESIVAEFHEEAEAYWGLVLCKYGIEYVDDPATGKKVPTCHRSSFNSVMDDADFEMVMENSDTISRQVYREQAKELEEIRKGIIEVSGKEQPYDIFICYKETSKDGERTIDSVLAQDVYDALTDKGYRVFFSRITLEDKLGQEYEPYIFAALNSAKVMLAFGTEYDYYNAVWVKNEWSRFLKLMAVDKSKHLIPCYKNIDAYDIPKEFAKLQAQDMGKVGAIQDLVRGIDKLLGKSFLNESVSQSVRYVEDEAVTLKKGYLALEDKAWGTARSCFNEIINKNPEHPEAYWGLALEEQECSSLEEFVLRRLYRTENIAGDISEIPNIKQNEIDELICTKTVPNYLHKRKILELFECNSQYTSFEKQRYEQLQNEKDYFENDKYLKKAIRYANDALREKIEKAFESIIVEMNSRLEEAIKHDAEEKNKIENEQNNKFDDAIIHIEELYKNAVAKRANDYVDAKEEYKNAKTSEKLLELCDVFDDFGDYEDSEELSNECAERAKALIIKAKAKKKKRLIIAISSGVALLVAVVALALSWKTIRYNYANSLIKGDKYEKGYEILLKGNYKDAANIINDNEIERAKQFLATQEYEQAYSILRSLGNYKDAQAIMRNSYYERAEALYNSGDIAGAEELISHVAAEANKDVETLNKKIAYAQANALAEAEKYEEAINKFESIKEFEDSYKRLNEILLLMSNEYSNKGDYKKAYSYLDRIKDTAYTEQKKQVAYQAAEKAYEAKDYKEAYEYYTKAIDYEDSYEKQHEVSYVIATGYYDTKDYKYAVEWFIRCGTSYKDAVAKSDESKYQYVLTHKSENDKTTKSYLSALKNKKYKDAVSISRELYKWKAQTMCFNNSENGTNNMTSISRSDVVYWHFKITGGDGSHIRIKAVGQLPACSPSTTVYDYNFYDGDEAWYSLYYMYGGSSGAASFKLYNADTGELLLSDSVGIY